MSLHRNKILTDRPTCDIDGCNNPAHNMGDYKFRKSSRVKEMYGGDGYICYKHHAEYYNITSWQFKLKKDYCENGEDGRLGIPCTTTVVHANTQLHIDHVDGNPSNNVIENFQTLCASCHSWKTYANGDHLTKGKK